MAGRVSFNITYITENADQFPKIAARLGDLTPFFENVINKWADDNKDKFGMSSGKESSGLAMDDGVFWRGLTDKYMVQKRRKGYANHLMVATGELMGAMTDPEGFFRAVTLQEAVFGSPKSAEDQDKVTYNWETRQVIFLSVDDQRMIEKELQDYLSLGPEYRDLQFERGLEVVRNRREDAQLNLEFNDAIS